MYVVERATIDDGPAMLQLLSASDLPIDALLDHLETAFVARVAGRLVGCAALEVYADGALLRSVAVHRSARGVGLGQRLVESSLQLARTLNLPAVYLLTTTAETFFPKLSFSRISREAVPEGVRQSVEFRSACPSTATAMMRSLAIVD